MTDNGQLRAIKLVRLWTLTLFGVVMIVFGLIKNQADNVMLGFGVLGAEPMFRAYAKQDSD